MGNSKRNIVYIFTNDPWGKYSGWKSQTKNLIDKLKKRNRFYIYTYGDDKDDVDYDIINVIKNYDTKIIKLLVAFLYVLIIVKKRKQIDVIYLPKSHLTVLPITIMGSLYGIKVVTRISGGELDDSGFKQLLKNYLISYSYECIALNQRDYLRLKELDISTTYIPNAINLNKFHPLSFQKSGGELQLCTFGSVSTRKKTDLAIKVFDELLKKEVEAKLTIIGPTSGFGEYDNEYVESIFELVEDLNLKNKIQFAGEVYNPEQYLQKCDVILFPSLSEGMPNALLEAMACGCVPVANSIPGVKEIIENGINGFLIMNNNFDTYVKVCIELYNNENYLKELKTNTVEYIKINFDASKVYESYNRIFNSSID